MTIQRQYSLPNCKLVLEGWGNESESSGAVGLIETRPALTILVNAECHFSGHGSSVSGGREFLESLVSSVSQYAQQVLSGVSHSERHPSGHPLVQLQPVSSHIHRLIVRQPKPENGAANPAGDAAHETTETTVQIDLSTVQLFDLVEAIDQMVADAQTLPDISIDLRSVPKRQTVSQEPVTDRVVPAAVGVAGLAVAAIALFFIPPPEFRPTEQEPAADEQIIDEGDADGTTLNDSPDPVDASEDEISGENDGANLDATPSSSPAQSSSGSGSNSLSSVNALPSDAAVEELFAAASPISDSDTIETLISDLRDRLDDAWDNDPSFDEPVEYRVGVSEAGDIVGFRYPGDNRDLAIEAVDELPLMDLLVLPDEPEALENQPIAQLRVVFRPDGVIEVSSWY